MFKKAVKHESKLRLAIAGPSGSGKTYTALAIGTALGKVALVDTESGSASKYADIFPFDVAEMHAPFHPRKYAEAILAAAAAGYDVIILDSLSHAWFATGGVLDIVDEAAKRSRSNNTYMAWKEGTPAQNMLVEAIVTAPIHVIGTMRSKTEYALVTNDRGKQEPRKMGMAPIQRDGFEYEFDVMLDMDIENTAVVTKSRCSALAGKVLSKPGRDVAGVLREWLSGAPAVENVKPKLDPVIHPNEVRLAARDDYEMHISPGDPTPERQTVTATPEPEQAPEYTDDELAIYNASARDFFTVAATLIPRYDHPAAVKNAAKKLQFAKVPADALARVEMYCAIRDYALARDAEEAGADAAQQAVLIDAEFIDKNFTDGAYAE